MDSSPAAPAQPSVPYSLRDAGDADLQELPDQNTEDSTTATFISQFESVEEIEAMDVPMTMVERGGPSLNEVKTQGLGPMEELDDEVFRVVARPLKARAATTTTIHHDNTATATKDVVVCKFCHAEFPYLVREVDHHKSICEGYKQHQQNDEPRISKTTIAMGAETNAMVDEKDEEDEDMDMPDLSLDVDVEDEEDEEETQLNEGGGSREEDQSRGIDSPAPEPSSEQEINKEHEPQLGQDASDQQQTQVAQEGESKQDEDDETEILESDPRSALTPDRIDSPGVVATPVLKVVPRRSDADENPTTSVTAIVAVGEDASPDVERGAASDDDESMDNGSTPSETNGDGGDATTSSDTKMSYRIFEDANGTSVRALCLICGKDVSNRGGAKATHRKKCRKSKQTPQHRVIPSDDKQVPLLQTMTPKKKPAKRRINQELDSLDQDAFDMDDEGPYRLRSGKKAKLDHPSTSAEAPAASSTDSAATALTVMTPMAQGSAPQNRAPAAATAQHDEDPLDQFDLVDDVLHAKRMVCKHCKTELSFRRDHAKRHLNSCDAAIKATQPASQQRTSTSSKELTLALMRHPELLTVEQIVAMDADTLRTWLYGSAPKADEALHSYGKAPLVMRGPTARPMARFQAIVNVLAGLDVKSMMDQSLSGTQFTAMVGRMCTLPLPSTSAAWQVYQVGNPIAFRPPEVIAQMLVPSLAADLRCGNLVTTAMHDVKVICALTPFTCDWQYHKTDAVVVCLRGKFLWKMKRSPVKAPTTCFHAAPTGCDPARGVWEDSIATHLLGAPRGCTAADLAPPTSSSFAFSNEDEDDDEDMRDGDGDGTRAGTASSGGQQVVVDAGSVVYMPPGTWYHAKALEGNAVLLQIQLQSGGLGKMMAEAFVRLVAQPEWVEREREILGSPTPRRDIHQLVRATLRQIADLQSTDWAPPLLFDAKDDVVLPTELVVHGSANTQYVVKWYEIDLADRNGFTGGKELQLLAGSMFRVNPMTALMAVDELQQFGATSMAPSSTTLASAAIAMAAMTPKKALNRKQKRANHASNSSTSMAMANGAIASQAKNVYVLVWGSGDATRMMVKFHCSAVQRVLVEWIRSYVYADCRPLTHKTSDAFHVAELKKLLASVQGGTADTDELKHVLRFLWAIGYVANVEVPL